MTGDGFDIPVLDERGDIYITGPDPADGVVVLECLLLWSERGGRKEER